MKLGRFGLFLFNVFFIVIVIVMIDLNYDLWRDGTISFLQFLSYSGAFIIFWRITKARSIQSALGKIFGWDPFAGMAAERRRFNAWYNAQATQKAQRQADQNAAAQAARYAAKDKALWHEYQAKKYAGSNDGYWHANQAKKYRNDAR